MRTLRLRVAVLLCVVPAGAAQGNSASLEQHLRVAQQAQSQGDCHTAAREYAAAVRLLPSSGELRANEGIALYCDEQTDAAIAALQKAIALKASLVAPHLFLGLAWNRQGEYVKSAGELEGAVQLNPPDPRGHLWLGYTYAAQQRYEPAIAQFHDTLRLDPGNTDAEYALGESELEMGRGKARELAVLAPKSPWLMKLEGEQQEMSGDSQSAQATLAQAAQHKAQPATTNADSRPREEQLYREAHDAEQRANDAFRAVLGGAPDSYRAHEILADSYAARQQHEAALAEYRIVLQLNPGLPGIHEAISYSLMLQHRSADALLELREEQKLQPRSAQAVTEIGRVQLDSGDDPGAIASLRTALALGDPPPDASVLLGKALLRTGDTAGAIANLQTAVKRDGNAPMPYYLLARAYRTTGNKEAMNSALASFKRLSQDEAARHAMERATQGIHAAPPLLTAEEVQDAQSMAPANP